MCHKQPKKKGNCHIDKKVEVSKYCSKIPSQRNAATPKGLALENRTEG